MARLVSSHGNGWTRLRGFGHRFRNRLFISSIGARYRVGPKAPRSAARAGPAPRRARRVDMLAGVFCSHAPDGESTSVGERYDHIAAHEGTAVERHSGWTGLVARF
jgi:hypothetical protein